jgi:hypothetical protein
MKTSHIIILSLVSTILGILFLAYQQEWILIRSPWKSSSAYCQMEVSKQKITLYYPSVRPELIEGLKNQTKELIVPDDQEKKAAAIIAAWLTLAHDEKIVPNKITLQSTLFSSRKGYLYVSFDQPLFSKQQSTHSKWMLLQSLIKTLQQNGIALAGVYFLVNHEVMQDDHLDFSNAWVAQ